jgi:uncharacterized protein YjbI with pentapeptide repeats
MNAIAPDVRLDHARLNDALLGGARLHGATLDGADACGASFRESKLQNASMKRADLRGAKGLPIADGRVVNVRSDEAILPGQSAPRWWKRARRWLYLDLRNEVE